jgi:hypothetical protein
LNDVMFVKISLRFPFNVFLQPFHKTLPTLTSKTSLMKMFTCYAKQEQFQRVEAWKVSKKNFPFSWDGRKNVVQRALCGNGKIFLMKQLGLELKHKNLIAISASNIVAAMLVSPLMGPVMSITFGTIISDWELVVSITKHLSCAVALEQLFMLFITKHNSFNEAKLFHHL